MMGSRRNINGGSIDGAGGLHNSGAYLAFVDDFGRWA